MVRDLLAPTEEMKEWGEGLSEIGLDGEGREK